MKLFLVERTDEVEWDEVRAAVVVAESEEAAKQVQPKPGERGNGWYTAVPPLLKATYLGEAAAGIADVILIDVKAA